MRALLHHSPHEPSDSTRQFRLEVQIGGEVFHSTCTVSKMEYNNHPRAMRNIKHELVTRLADELLSQIYEQIGRD